MSKICNGVVFLDRGNYTTCTLHLHGGTIMSYRVRNKEMLYIKERTEFDNISAIRGGIKFTFPYFGRRINGPKHGFARYVPWKLEDGPNTLDDGNVEVVYSLQESEYTKSIWNYKFKITTRLTLCLNHIKIHVKVENTCSHFPFSFTIMRHTIFRVRDVTKCRFEGLEHCNHADANSTSHKLLEPIGTDFQISTDHMNVFLDTPPVVELKHIDESGIKVRLISNDTREVLFYNAWDETNKDVPEDSLHNPKEYLKCIGLGNGTIYNEILLEPKESWESYQIIEVVDEEYDAKIEKLGLLLNNPWELFKESCTNTNFI